MNIEASSGLYEKFDSSDNGYFLYIWLVIFLCLSSHRFGRFSSGSTVLEPLLIGDNTSSVLTTSLSSVSLGLSYDFNIFIFNYPVINILYQYSYHLQSTFLLLSLPGWLSSPHTLTHRTLNLQIILSYTVNHWYIRYIGVRVKPTQIDLGYEAWGCWLSDFGNLDVLFNLLLSDSEQDCFLSMLPWCQSILFQ